MLSQSRCSNDRPASSAGLSTTWIAQEEERDRLTQEALADVDAGLVIDPLAVQAWADSLGTDQPLPLPR